MDTHGEGRLGEAFARMDIDHGSVFLDLSGLTSMGATGIRAIVTAARRLARGDVIVHGTQARVAPVLGLTGIKLSERVRVVPDSWFG